MDKMKRFFVGILLMAFTFASVFLVALIYRANERSSIKSYIFQMNDYANFRVGELQDLSEISAVSLRNELIKKYVYEYFKVIPGDTNVENRPVLRTLSSEEAYKTWTDTEAKKIQKMSDNNMFRMVQVMDDGIVTEDRPENYNYYTSELAENIHYSVRYYTKTWESSNNMEALPAYGQGIIYIEARFKPGILENIVQETSSGSVKKMSLRKYLESGYNPVGLFMFKVTNIKTKENK